MRDHRLTPAPPRRRQTHHRPVVRALVIIAALVGAAACGGASAPAETAGVEPATSVSAAPTATVVPAAVAPGATSAPYESEPTVRTHDDLRDLRWINPRAANEYVTQVMDQGERNIEECMRRAGFEYFPQTFSNKIGRLPQSADRDLVALQGLGIAAPLVSGQPLVSIDDSLARNREYRAGLDESELALYEALLDEGSPHPEGEPVGCVDAGLIDVVLLSRLFGELDQPIRAARQAFADDPRIVALDERWAECMAEAGHDYRRIEDAEDEIRVELMAILGATGISLAIDSNTSAMLAASPQAVEQVTGLADRERAVALDGFDCEQPLVPDRLAIEQEYTDRLVNEYAGEIDRLLATD